MLGGKGHSTGLKMAQACFWWSWGSFSSFPLSRSCYASLAGIDPRCVVLTGVEHEWRRQGPQLGPGQATLSLAQPR